MEPSRQPVARRTALERISAALVGLDAPIAISEVASPAVVGAVAGLATSVRPVVRGRTVWDAGPPAATFVIESPNYLGRFETDPGFGRRVLITEAAYPIPEWQVAEVVTVEGEGTTPLEGRLTAARVLAKHLNQIGGVTCAFGMPESPTFVVLTGVDPEPLAARMTLAAEEMTVDPVAVPGLPGALRLSVIADTTPARLLTIAATFETVLSDGAA